jgi:hypothetical protein
MLIIGAILSFIMAAIDISLIFVFLFVIRYSIVTVLVIALIYGIAIAFFICCGVYGLKLKKLALQKKYKNTGLQMNQELMHSNR